MISAAAAGCWVDVDVDVGAGLPVDVRCVYRILDISTIEVDEFLGGTREAKYAPEVRESVGDTIGVKHGIKQVHSSLDKIVDATSSADS